MRGVWLISAMLLGLATGASTGGCLGTSATNCSQYRECSTCVMEAACSFCLETNACIADDATCPGDRAQTPDMCAE